MAKKKSSSMAPKKKAPKKKVAKKKVAKKKVAKKKVAKKKVAKKKVAKKKGPPHTGSLAANLHEGGRSEYLAHYAFSSFGAAHLVPRQEDHGLDLFCTLTEKDGQRLWPIGNYCVQIKSSDSSWEFPSEKSVQWFARYPLPIFFCVVDKSKLTLKVFHTTPRFFIWTHFPEAKRLVLVPGETGTGYGAEWEESHYKQPNADTFPLSAPIAEFSVEDLLDEKIYGRIKVILANWVRMDQSNIIRIQTGLPLYRTFSEYQTNIPPDKAGEKLGYRAELNDEELRDFKKNFAEQNKWLSWFLAENEDYRGALRSDLLLRHLDLIDWLLDSHHGYFLHSKLNKHFKLSNDAAKNNFYAGLDGLSKRLDELTSVAINEAHEAKESNVKQLSHTEAASGKEAVDE